VAARLDFPSRSPWFSDILVLSSPYSEFRSQLLQILIPHVEGGEIAGLAAFRSYKDAVIAGALKVSLALDAAIVLACRFVEGDADPDAYTRYLRDKANIGDGSPTRI
jgi:hypothetical protein